MVQKKSKRTLVTTLSILAVLLIAISTVALIKVLNPAKQDPYVQQESSSTSDSNDNATTNDTQSNQSDEPVSSDNDTSGQEPALDPATVSTIDIVPMAITVSYVKGVGGFEYEVLRANNGTRYVEFRSPQLVGTKCTNDDGTFVSILANPTEGEQTTLAKKTTVDGVVYGLSMAGTTCASDTEKLQAYQKSFSDAFSLLKKID